METDINVAVVVSDDTSISVKKDVVQDRVEASIDDVAEDRVEASIEYVAEVVEVDKDELARDKIVDELWVYYVGGATPADTIEVAEQEIVEKLSKIGISVVYMKTFSNFNGNFDQSRVKTSPVNLKDIWGRRLGLKNCAVIKYRHPPCRN